MSDVLPACPQCHEAFAYEQGALLVCPMCGHEWAAESDEAASEAPAEIKDSVGNVIADGHDRELDDEPDQAEEHVNDEPRNDHGGNDAEDSPEGAIHHSRLVDPLLRDWPHSLPCLPHGAAQ
jgi:uncharacterized Zn finger protein (UPF0148 family)